MHAILISASRGINLVFNFSFLRFVMAENDWVPEIVVGIDFGMTCTGLSESF